MGHPARTSHSDFNIRDLQPEIGMYQLTETVLYINSLQIKSTGALSISHHAIVRTHNACKKTKAKYALPVFMLHAFIINQRDLFLHDAAEHLLVMRLHFFGVRKEQIGLALNQFIG